MALSNQTDSPEIGKILAWEWLEMGHNVDIFIIHWLKFFTLEYIKNNKTLWQ